jgi:hypothetical protein
MCIIMRVMSPKDKTLKKENLRQTSINMWAIIYMQLIYKFKIGLMAAYFVEYIEW